MKKSLLCTVVGFMLLTPSLFSQDSAPSSAPIPEEARKHFVMGATLFKDAKSAEEFSQVEHEFKQAVDLAPQWPDARYNLALTKEAAGDFRGAMEDMKVYQQFELSNEDARKAQDKIYALEARQAKSDSAAKPAAEAAVTTPVIERYECPTPQNERTVSQNFAFNFSSHTVTLTIDWGNSRADFSASFDESGQLLVIRRACAYQARPLGCGTINRATSRLMIYAWGRNGGEDGPRGDMSGGPNTVEYSCHAAK